MLLVSSKLPGKMIIWLTFSVCLLIIFVLGFGIGRIPDRRKPIFFENLEFEKKIVIFSLSFHPDSRV